MVENKETKKSIDDLLATKKSKDSKTVADKSNDLRGKMNRLVDANKVFSDVDFQDKTLELQKLEEEKSELEKEVKDLNKKLKALYNLKYNEIKLIDKKSDDVNKEIINALENAKHLSEEDKERTEAMAFELESLQKQIKSLKANNIASKKASEEAIAAANLATDAANKARLAFEEKERSANRGYKEEIEKLNKQLEDMFNKLNKSNVEKNKLKNTLETLKKANKDHLTNLEKVEQDLELANIEKEKISARLIELENLSAKNDVKLAKLNEVKLSLKEDYQSSQKEAVKQVNKVNKLLEEKQELKDKFYSLQKEYNKLNQKVEKLSEEKANLLNNITELKLELNNTNASLRKLEKQSNDLNNKQASANEKFKEEKKNIKLEYLNQIKELNKEITKLNNKIKDKDSKIKELKEEIKNFNHDEQDKIIDDLSLKLVNHEEEISLLQDKNKELENKLDIIPSLQEKIDLLKSDISSKEEQILILQEQVKEPKIDESVIKEMEDLQSELDKSLHNLEEMRVQKLNLEIELQKAYKALKEQEDLLALQENLITKQQIVLDKRDKEYKESLINYESLERKYNDALIEYEKNVSLLKDDNSRAQDKLNDVFEIQNKLDEANLQVQKLSIEVEDYKNEILELKSIKEQNEVIIKQYLNDIETNEKKVSEYLVNVSQSEIYVTEIKNRLSEINSEYAQYKLDKENELNKLKEELKSVKERLNSYEDSSKKLELSKFNEERLQQRIFDLENSIKILSVSDNHKSDDAIISSLEQYRSLLANEREEHLESETVLSEKIKDLSFELEDLNRRFLTYSSSYIASKLNKQIASVNDIINNIKTGKTLLNRDIYFEYYEEALKTYYEQKKIYSSELDKRNDFLQIIKSEKEEEIKDLSYELQISGANSIASSKLKVLYQQIKDIDLLLNSSVRSYSLLTSKQVEEEILKNFKKDLFNYHKQMEENIKNIEDNIDAKYNEISNFEELLNIYGNDCVKMAEQYSLEISRLYQECSFDNNELSNIMREEKILMLVNEFQNLVRIRDDKFNEIQTKLNTINSDSEPSYEKYNDSLNKIEDLKMTLLKKLESIKLEEQRVKDILFDERKRVFEDIEALRDQLERLDSFSNDEFIEEDRKKINILLSAKKEKIMLIDEERIPELEEKYGALKEEIKLSYDDAINEEKNVKESFARRKEAVLETKNINSSLGINFKKLNTYEDINSHLIDFNNIEDIYNKVKNNRISYRPKLNETKQNNFNNLISKYHNLWALYDKYELAKKTMEEDFEEIRAYNNFKLEASSAYRKYSELLKELDVSEERYRSGLDLDTNIIKGLNAKANTCKSRFDYLNKQANELLRYNSVSDYTELISKIDQIIHLIKQMDKEIEGINI